MKTCSRCELTKPLSEYHKRSNSKDGVQNYCKECKRAADVDYHAKSNPNVSVKRRTYEAQSKPAWASNYLISVLYAQRATIEKLSGVQLHLDHIDPLNHPLVCGLHVETNLRIITASDNLAKSNNFTPYRIDREGNVHVLN